MQSRYIHISISKENVADLRGKKSVRTTFRLPDRSIMALSLLAAQLGIKQKSLFDHLGEDVNVLRACAAAAEQREKDMAGVTKTAKTYVVSKKTLENLERVAATSKASRDALVASSIERIMPLLLQEKKKHRQRKDLLMDTQEWLLQGEDLLVQSLNQLGEEDPAVQEISAMLQEARRAFANLTNMVEKGEQIEKF